MTVLSSVPSRRLEDRIRSLCSKVVSKDFDPKIEPVISELKAALREHNSRLRKLAATQLASRMFSRKRNVLDSSEDQNSA